VSITGSLESYCDRSTKQLVARLQVVWIEVPVYTRILDAPKPLRIHVFLSLFLLLLPVLPVPASVPTATGHFEVYCDGVGIFLAKIDGTPAPGKLVFFSRMGFPPGTIGGRYFGQGKWSDVYVFRDGCVPDGKCDSIADGKVWIDASDMPDNGDTPPKRISGKYEIDLNGRHLEGAFVANRHVSKHPLRICM
jgi:hypothetical protein